MPVFRPSPLEVRDAVRETLAGAGLTETVSHALVSPALAERFAWAAETPPVEGGTPALGRPITVTNPLSADHSVLRRSVTGSLVEIVSTNVRRGREDVAIFEIGKGYGHEPNATHEWTRLAVALTGPLEPPSWNRPGRPADLDDAKGILELVARRLGFDAPSYRPLRDEPLLHPGRSAAILALRDGATALSGVVGELHPTVAEEMELRGRRVVVAEVEIRGLAGGRLADVRAGAPSRHPAAERDLAVVVAEDVEAAAVAEAIRGAGGGDLRRVTLFDIYRGTPLARTEKSLAWRLVFQADDRTLTEAEVESAVAEVTAAVGRLGGRIRT
jgi:phenylalanyl-tRNA synthetase beta chain